MKQKQITTGKATIVVVDMPEDVKLEEVNSIEGMINFQTSCLGHFSQISEDQWKDIVDFDDKPIGYFRNYLYHTIQAPHIWKKLQPNPAYPS